MAETATKKRRPITKGRNKIPGLSKVSKGWGKVFVLGVQRGGVAAQNAEANGAAWYQGRKRRD